MPLRHQIERWLQVGLGCVQLSPSCPFGPLHTSHFLRPARLRTPLLRYGAPHLSARGTSTLLNNALLSTHFRVADHPGAMRVRANRNAAGYQASTHSDYSSLSTAFRNAFTDVLAAWAAAGS